MEIIVPQNFRKKIESVYGSDGKDWLKDLPGIVEKCRQQWNFTMESDVHDLSYNFIASIRLQDNRPAILKIGFPKEKEILTEMASLEYFPKKYSVQMLEKDTGLRAFILEKLTPGTRLRDMHMQNDSKATTIALPLIQGLSAAIPMKHTFPSLADWANVFGRIRKMNVKEGIDHSVLDHAKQIFEKLDSTKKEEKLLHGDLHHDNILFDDKRGWIAIDPKGVIGDPTSNGSRFIINNWSNIPATELLQSRVNMIAKALGCDEARVAGWAYVDYIISHCWTMEESGKTSIDLAFIKALETLV